MALGWYVGGLASPFNLPSASAQTDHPAVVAVATESEGQTPGMAASENGETDAGQQAARLIAPDPQQPEQISWYGSVVAGVVVLFVAAILLGYPTLKFQGPPPPDPAADHHGHDDHGGGHGADAHGHDARGAQPAAGHATH